MRDPRSAIGQRAATTRPGRPLPAWLAGVFLLAVAVTYIGFIGHAGLSEPDEPRYAEIPREMLERGDWVTPTLNYVKYFEKPPLLYWLTAVNFLILGTSEFVARLWPALLGVVGIALVGVLARSMYDATTGWIAAAVLATIPLYFALSQTLILDMPLSTLLTAAMAAFWFAYRTPATRHRWMLLVYVATALAVLTKGPVAVILVGGSIGGFLVVRGEWRALRWVLSPLGVLLGLLIVLPWFVLVSHRNPEFLDFFVIDQHVRRYAAPTEHKKPIWFFVPIVFGGMLPWSLFLLAPRRVMRFARQMARRRVSAATTLCLCWAGVVFTFFSLSGSKLATYILPMFCPAALLVARYLVRTIADPRAVVLQRGGAGVLAIAALLPIAAVVIGGFLDDPRVRTIVPHLWAAFAVLGATGVGTYLLTRRRAPERALAVLTGGMLLFQTVVFSAREIIPHYETLGMVIRTQAHADDLVIVYRHYVQSIVYYAQRRVIMVGGHGELDFGSRQGDQRAYFWTSDDDLVAAWRSGRRVFLVINRSELEPLHARLVPPPRQIAAHGKKVLIVNFPDR